MKVIYDEKIIIISKLNLLNVKSKYTESIFV